MTPERAAVVFERALDAMEEQYQRAQQRIRMLEGALRRLDEQGGLGAERHEQIRALLAVLP